MSQEITFRRIHGRIVPIRVSKKNKDLAAGAGLAVGGVGAAAAAGKIAASLVHKGAGYENVSRAFDKASEFAFEDGRLWRAQRSGKLAIKFGRLSEQHHKAARAVRNAGFVISSALIGAGINSVLKHTRLNDDEKTRAAIATGSAVGASFALNSTYLKGVSGMVGTTKTAKAFSLIKAAMKKALVKAL